jgi:Tfp pilus assembly protein FimT
MLKAARGAGERGFSALQLMITVVVVAIVSTFAIMNIATARQRITLSNAAKQVSRYLEKARTDSVKRHADQAAQQASIQVLSATTYRLKMDFDTNGTLGSTETQDFILPDGVTFVTNPMPPTIAYDWRGRLTSSARITVQNANLVQSINIDLSGGGDITTNSTVTLPAMTSTPYPTPTLPPTGGASPTPTPSPSPPVTSGIPECFIGADNSTIIIRKSGLSTGYINLTLDVYGNGGTVTTTYDSGSIRVSPNSASLQSLAPYQFSVVDIKGGGKDYNTPITFDSPCGTETVYVTVTQ